MFPDTDEKALIADDPQAYSATRYGAGEAGFQSLHTTTLT